MKRLVFVTATFIFSAMLIMVGCVEKVFAQTPATKPVVSNVFDTDGACLAQLGRVPYYKPTFLGGARKNPPNGTTRVVHPPEEDACIDALTVRGRKWAPVKGGKDGTVLRWNIANGHVPYAIDACGNKVFGIVYPGPPPPVTTEATTSVAPTPAASSKATPINLTVSEGPTKTTPTPAANVGRGHKKWWVAAAIVAAGGVTWWATRDKGCNSCGVGPDGRTGPAF